MVNLRRISLLVAAMLFVGALPALLVSSSAVGQVAAVPPQPGQIDPIYSVQPQPKQPEYKPGTKFSAIKLVENEEYQKSIEQAMDALNGGDYQEACEYLQAILDSKEDVFARVEVIDKDTGEKKSHSVSVKYEADLQLAKMPEKGLQAYELKYGATAKQLLDQAKQTGNRETLAEVASRFRHTKAGKEANELLATTYLDRARLPNEFFHAALCYEKIIGPDPLNTTASDLTLFKAALAFKRAGDNKQFGTLWNVLAPRIKANGGLSLANGQMATLKQVEAVLAEGPKEAIIANPHDWPMPWGNHARNAQAKGSPPMLDYVLWQRQTFMDKNDITGGEEPGTGAKPYLDRALDLNLKNPSHAVMPGGFPVASNDLLFYRTYNGISAVCLKDILDKDGSVEAKAGSIYYRTMPFSGALATALDTPNVAGSVGNWINTVYMQSGFSNLLFENSTVGTLTTDNRLLYAIDDLAVPIPPKYLQNHIWNQPGGAQVHEEAKKLVMQNRLRAFNMMTGKVEWELGATEANKSDAFSNTHFICTPLAVGGKLYVLNEKNNGDPRAGTELRLVCLETQKIQNDEGKEKWSVQVVQPIQKLGTIKPEHTYLHDMARRVNAIHLAYAEGILVCPTNAGEILGVDLMSRSLAWAYKYRDKPPNPLAFPNPQRPDSNLNTPIALSYANWKVSPPVIVDGKVVFTAPDSSAVCCLNLRDGSELWTSPQHDADLYLAGVYLDKVLIVGKNSVRALRLKDGAPTLPPLQTGDLPSGQGVASNNIYYLPLKKGEICAIDLDKWAIKARNRASKTGGPSPGNLVFYEGMVLSQTPTAIIAYPQLAAKLLEAETAYTKNPTVQNLLSRGELRLADGQLQKAVDDLFDVLSKEPPATIVPRTKDRLYEALGDLLNVDFANAADKYLKDYKELTKVPGNPRMQQEREAKYSRTVGQGREAQGNLVEAFLAYKEFGGSPLYKDSGIPSLEDPLCKVPTHLWLRGRISALFAKATPAQRETLDAKIGEEWAAVKKKNDINAVRQFTDMFDVPVAVGREARLELANVILQNKAKNAFLEAELNLQQLRVPAYRQDAKVGGKALEALARLEIAKGTDDALRLAASYYREINKDFAKDVIRDGKTGADLFNSLAEDPRLRPFLEEANILWGNAEIKHRDLPRDTIQGVSGFVFQPEGDLTPVMQQHRLIMDTGTVNNPVLRYVDMSTNKERWNTTLGQQANVQFFNYLYNQANNLQLGYNANTKYRFYQVKGHLAVVQVGTNAYGLDLDNGKVLWHHTLFETPKGANNLVSMTMDEQGRVWALYQTNVGGQVKSRIGQIGTVQATYVALITSKGLVVLDPVKGTPLWTKSGLGSNTEIFGDDQHIYYVDTADGAAVGAGRCVRASDGALVEVPDFGFYYRNAQRILGGRNILTAEPNGKSLTMRLYDAAAGKTLWKQSFDNDPAVLQTEDENYCGVIERTTGKLTLLDARDGKEIIKSDLKQFRISAEDLKELHRPVLLDDGQNFFVMLNTKYGAPRNVTNVWNNFSGGTRCLPVNGWICCLDRKGEFVWHSHDRYMNQMIVAEQFKTLPILLFTSRYFEQSLEGRGNRIIARTGSLSKVDGKAIWWSPETNLVQVNIAQFSAFTVDLKVGTINMIGTNGVVQHYVDDGRAGQKEGGGGQEAQAAQKTPASLDQDSKNRIISEEEQRRLLLEALKKRIDPADIKNIAPPGIDLPLPKKVPEREGAIRPLLEPSQAGQLKDPLPQKENRDFSAEERKLLDERLKKSMELSPKKLAEKPQEAKDSGEAKAKEAAANDAANQQGNGELGFRIVRLNGGAGFKEREEFQNLTRRIEAIALVQSFFGTQPPPQNFVGFGIDFGGAPGGGINLNIGGPGAGGPGGGGFGGGGKNRNGG